MTKVKLAITVAAALVLAGCAQTDDAGNALRNGPQTQSPTADAQGGKLPDGTTGMTSAPVIIDDSAPMMAPAVTAPATTGSIFEFIG